MRGWIDRDQLCQKLDMDIGKLNVEIYRARKQLSAVAKAAPDGFAAQVARLKDIEDQYAARLQGVMDPPEQGRERFSTVVFIEQVIETLADRRDCSARR